MTTAGAMETIVRNAFSSAGLQSFDVELKRYPEETIFIVTVPEDDLEAAAKVGNDLDGVLASRGFDGFVTVRRRTVPPTSKPAGRVTGVHDSRTSELVRQLQARSRASETQPSLSYVKDTVASLAKVAAPRHHLVFGRRGAGKTALLVEAKRQVESAGDLVVWTNLQPHRWSTLERTTLSTLRSLISAIRLYYADSNRTPQVVADASRLEGHLERLLSEEAPSRQQVQRLVPEVQALLRRFGDTAARDLYVFLDDFYFVPRQSQVELLDLLHASVRDTRVWLKVATIRHLSRWFEPSRQAGLQLGHDADSIDLDVTLQDPSRAKSFLEEVLRSHATNSGITSITRVFSTAALDRLVLASGSVPRDYLLLAANAILQSQERVKARLVGVQDVNRAAGEAAQLKLQELEEDLSPDSSWARRTRVALELVRNFCLEDKKWTYFRIEHQDREAHTDAYDDLASLMDLRLIHLLNPSVSDERKAGVKYEAYLLDLSQYSGERLRKNIHVLDFDGGKLIQKQTGTRGTERAGDTARKMLQILRRGPVLPLDLLARLRVTGST
jgi:hypothetical protein